MEYYIGIGVFILIVLYQINRFFDTKAQIAKDNAKSNKNEIERKRLQELYIQYQEQLKLKQEETAIELQNQFNQKYKALKFEISRNIQSILKEKTNGFPWLAKAFADYYANLDLIYANHLETKPRPAKIQAEKIKEIAEEKRIFKKEFLTAKYIINYYESLFPWLQDYTGIDSQTLFHEVYNVNKIKDDQDKEQDPVQLYLTNSEYITLPTVERNQKALDKYWRISNHKTSWQIGRDYERFVGYSFEKQGYKVSYFGANKGFEDYGRDLICSNKDTTLIIQCKYWSKEKGIPIRENHINQLFGTTIQFCLSNLKKKPNVQMHLFPEFLRQQNIIPVIVTSTVPSETAKEFAEMLGVKVMEEQAMDYTYPSIKCNISQTNGNKIYHLPFDQQYDKVVIEPEKGEMYVKTVAEAEKLGFRRAWKWKGNK